MFHPTPSCLFKPVPALMKLKIHHPLPLSARESTALLNLLTSSFRKNLDAEHPISQPEEHTRLGIKLKGGKTISRQTGTDMHMQSVLTNPLFNSPASRQENIHFDTPIVQYHAMETFERAVGRGMMDIHSATICLLATKKQIVASSVLNIRDGMKASGAGLKVLNWMKASGLDNNLDFLQNPEFPKILLEFMVAEGLQEAAWKWIKMSFDTIPASNYLTGLELKAAQKSVAMPLFRLVQAEMLWNESLDAAYLCMSRAAAYLKGLPAREIRPILGAAGYYIYKQTLRTDLSRPSPTTTHFESFTSLVPILFRSHHALTAHLQLIHPSRPAADLAIDYLKKSYFKKSFFNEGHDTKSEERRVIDLGLDTARFLLKHQDQLANRIDLNWILHMLRSRFQVEMEEDEKTQQLEKVRAEATSLDMLARLGFS